MSRAFLVVSLLLLTPLAASVDAAASGGSSQATATLVGEGTHTGSANDGNGVWYRVSVPEGKAVHVAYTVVSGDTWNSLSFVDSTGTQVAGVSHNNAGAYDPDEPEAWVRIRGYWDGIDYSFTLSLVIAPPQDDAASGQDAGQFRSTALPVQPGAIVGRVREAFGDVADWYRIDVPVGTILDFHSVTGSSIYLISSDGTPISRVAQNGWFDPVTYSLVTGGPIYVYVDYGDPYGFVVAASKRADLRVDGVEVREIEAQTASGPTGVSYAREVVVTVSNVGEGHSRKASLLVRSTHEGPATSYRVLGERAVDLPAGGETTVSIPWDTTGQVGDVVVVATVTNEHDADLENDVGRTDSFVLVGGSPVDLDLLNHEARAAGNAVRVEYGGDRIGIAGPVGFVGFSRGILTLP